MSQDTNECRLTGTVEKIKPVTTKTGAAMAEIILKVRQDRFRVVGHGNVAQHLLASCGPGDRLSVTGTLSPSSWQDQAGEWRHSFAITAWGAEVHGCKVAFEKKQQARRQAGGQRQKYEPPTAQPGDPF